MSQSNALRKPTHDAAEWRELCRRQDLVADSGVVAWHEGTQVALFHLPSAGEKTLFAIENKDPRSGANVIGRGLVGCIKGELVIASPLYKQHFRLEDGSCLEYPEQRLRVWPVRLNGERVEIASA